MAINRIRQLDSIEMLPGDRFRIRLTSYFADSVGGDELPAREPTLVTLDPSVPAHQPAISALRSAWSTVFTLAKADR